LRLLVIDDDGDARELLSLVLQHHGAQVTMVESAHDAMEALDRSAPDLIVCDIGMPGEDGYTFIRRVRTLQKGVARVPAIALTAYARVEDRRQAVAAGFQLHVAKPIDPPELVTAIALLVRTEPLLKKVMS
jgi:CheY-like chemotaxis protein